MLSPKTKSLTGTLALTAVWLGTAAFAAIAVFPAVQQLSELLRELSALSSTLQERMYAPEPPNRGLIEENARIKENLLNELRAYDDFYLGIQREVLERRILDSRSGDPYRVAARFRALKRELEEAAGRADFMDLGSIAEWARRDDGRPEPEQFDMLEKKACIAEALVHVLTGRSGRKRPTITHLSVGDSRAAEGQPGLPQDDAAGGLRFRIFPVNLAVKASIEDFGEIAGDLVSAAPGAGNPFVAINRIEIESRKEMPAGTVILKIGANVLDFYIGEPDAAPGTGQ